MSLEIGGFSYGGLGNVAALDAQAGEQYRAQQNQFQQQQYNNQQHTQAILAQAAAEAQAQNQSQAKQQLGMDAQLGQQDHDMATVARQQAAAAAQQAFQQAQSQSQQDAENTRQQASLKAQADWHSQEEDRRTQEHQDQLDQQDTANTLARDRETREGDQWTTTQEEHVASNATKDLRSTHSRMVMDKNAPDGADDIIGQKEQEIQQAEVTARNAFRAAHGLPALPGGTDAPQPMSALDAQAKASMGTTGAEEQAMDTPDDGSAPKQNADQRWAAAKAAQAADQAEVKATDKEKLRQTQTDRIANETERVSLAKQALADKEATVQQKGKDTDDYWKSLVSGTKADNPKTAEDAQDAADKLLATKARLNLSLPPGYDDPSSSNYNKVLAGEVGKIRQSEAAKTATTLAQNEKDFHTPVHLAGDPEEMWVERANKLHAPVQKRVDMTNINDRIDRSVTTLRDMIAPSLPSRSQGSGVNATEASGVGLPGHSTDLAIDRTPTEPTAGARQTPTPTTTDSNHPPLQKYGSTYTWDGSHYVKQK